MQRIGFVGWTPIARAHARRYASISDAEVVAVADISSDTVTDSNASDDATTYETVAEMYDQADLDAVDVCTPPELNADVVRTAAERSLDVLCEPAIGTTVADGRAVVSAVAEAEIDFVAGHAAPFSPAHELAEERVSDGSIGAVGNVRATRRTDAVGNVIFGTLREFDFLRRVCGPVEHVYAQRVAWDDDEQALVTLRFEDGAVGHLDTRATVDSAREPMFGFELAGDAGALEHDSRESKPVAVRGRDSPVVERVADPSSPTDSQHRAITHFLACVADDEPSNATATDALSTLQIALAAHESAGTGVPVAPDAAG